MKNFNLWFFITTAWMRYWLRIYTRRFSTSGKEKLTWNKPMLIAANHQNAFLDGLVIGHPLVDRIGVIHYLIRADVFKNKIAATLLRSWKMEPAYRMRDGMESLSKNDETFALVQNLLKKNRAVVIYAEGNHGVPRTLRPLKKGIARIALGMDDRYGADHDIPVHMVPVGIFYSDPHRFGSDVLVNYGEPIDIRPFREQYRTQPAHAINALMDAVKKSLSALIIDIRTEKAYHAIEFVRELWSDHKIGHKAPLKARFDEEKRIIDALDFACSQQEEIVDKLNEKSNALKSILKKNKIRAWMLCYPEFSKASAFLRLLLLLLLFPFFLAGAAVHAFPFLKIINFLKNKIKDKGFQSSITYTALAFVFSLMYWIILVVLLIFVRPVWMAPVILVGIHFCGLIAVFWSRHYAKLKAMLTYNALKERKQDTYNEMHDLRGELLQLCENALKLKEKS